MNTPVREGETIEGSRTMRNRPYPVLKCSSCRALHPYLENPGYTWKIPCDRLGIVPISSILPRIFCPRPALRLRETPEFPEWSTKHPPCFPWKFPETQSAGDPLSVFLFVCRKSICRPSRGAPGARRRREQCSQRTADAVVSKLESLARDIGRRDAGNVLG